MAVRLRVLVKVVMVLVIILAVWHLTSNFPGVQRKKRDSENFDKKANDGDWHRQNAEGKEPSKGVGGDVDVLEREFFEENGDRPPQIDKEKSDNTYQIDEEKAKIGKEKDDTLLILLWNNYQGDKSALYNKIFHR